MISEISYNGILISPCQNLECKFENIFGTGMCKFGLGGLFYQGCFGLAFIGVFKWRVPVVFTANYTTRNRELLQSNDFLGNSDNRVVVTRTAPPT